MGVTSPHDALELFVRSLHDHKLGSCALAEGAGDERANGTGGLARCAADLGPFGSRGLGNGGRCHGAELGLNRDRNDEVGEERKRVGSANLNFSAMELSLRLPRTPAGSIVTQGR